MRETLLLSIVNNVTDCEIKRKNILLAKNILRMCFLCDKKMSACHLPP